MGSGPDINYPAQPSYGEGMADAMKAQMEQLLGQGDYAQMYADAGFAGGNLGDIIAGVEGPIRQQTAQVDTDVLRQTLLGNEKKFQVEKDPETGKYGITGAEVEVVKGEDGKPQTAGDSRYQMVKMSDTRQVRPSGSGFVLAVNQEPVFAIIDTQTGGMNYYGGEKYAIGNNGEFHPVDDQLNPNRNASYNPKDIPEIVKDASIGLQTIKQSIDDAGGDTDAGAKEFTFNNPYTGEPLKEGETVTIREGDGMIDLLGDSRNVMDYSERPDYAAYVINNDDLQQAYAQARASGDSRTIDQFGEDHYLSSGKNEGRDLPTTFEPSDTGRQAGFDTEGNFLGLSALAEDIQRGNLSRQREADLADVERLSGRYSDVMDQFRPGTQQALTDASAVLEAQKDNLTGAGAITVPGSSTYGGDITAGSMQAAQVGAAPSLTAGTSYTASQVADPMKLTAATSYDPSASVTGDGYTATANLEGGNIGADSLRAALLADAETALGQGLTEREQASISNAARARSGMMGRTFDQSGTIAEAQALVAENNARRMQNRAFAGDTLGREADIQRSDLDRGLQANIRNQDALNRAAEFGASQNMQAQLANQAATNQALSQGLTAGLSQEALAAQQQQAKAMADATAANRASEFGVGAGMEQDALRAQLGQQTNMAQAQFDQQANAFDADAAMRASQVNQAQAQQANQFGVGAKMDAQRLNEQLKQQGTLGYIDASTRLAALEDQYSLDPFQALLGRAGGGSLQAGQGVFGQAGYGLSSGPNYLNPESGLGYISNMAANQASMYGAQLAADATRDAGMMNMIGSIGGAGVGAATRMCWVAREVYGPTNPAWLQFREWMFAESPNWFFKLYAEYGERFANWISDKPRIKSIIRKWMDSKIGGK